MPIDKTILDNCGAPSPLFRLTTHLTSDQAHRDQGFGLPYSHEVDISNMSANDMAQEFLERQAPLHPSFRMDTLLHEIRAIELPRHGPIQGPGVAELATAGTWEMTHDWTEIKNFDPANAMENTFKEDGLDYNSYSLEGYKDVIFDHIWKGNHLNEHRGDEEFDYSWQHLDHNTEGISHWASTRHLPNDTLHNWAVDIESIDGEEKLKTNSSELWHEEDKKNPLVTINKNKSTNELQAVAGELLDTVDDKKLEYSKFLQFVKEFEEEGVKTGNNSKIWEEDFSVFLSKANESVGAAGNLAEAWPEEEKNIFSLEQWEELQKDLPQNSNKKESSQSLWADEFADYLEPYKTYAFEDDNPLKSDSRALEEGKKKLKAGDLPSAVLCFEAAVQQEPTNALAWELLGMTQAENERDPYAIPALKKCLELDPNNLTALMALAVSYTNENLQLQACHTLKAWLNANPKYSDLLEADYTSMKAISPSFISGTYLKDVQDLFIMAARRNPKNDLDPDVQCGLGVLFNLSDECDKAADCFKTALLVKSDDFRLWNRLGATLANGQWSEEAVEAYHNALRLSPGFIRARYNLGITCVNLQAYREAAEHFLACLNQQAAGKNLEGKSSNANMSSSIWSSLRLVVSSLDRHDLIDAVDNRNLVTLNKEFQV